jgi:hypothetical protein
VPFGRGDFVAGEYLDRLDLLVVVLQECLLPGHLKGLLHGHGGFGAADEDGRPVLELSSVAGTPARSMHGGKFASFASTGAEDSIPMLI